MKEKLREKAVPMHPKHTRTLTPCFLAMMFLVGLFLLQGCYPNEKDSRQQERPTAAHQVNFEHKVEAKYAEGFRISYHENYKMLEVLNPYQDIQDTLSYILKPRGITLHDSLHRRAQVIEIPVRTMIVTSTTHVALAEMLETTEIITGMSGAKYVFNPDIKARVEQGEVLSFSEGEFNNEQALSLDPDLVMVSAGQSSQFDDYRVLMNSGIGVFINAEWLETTPLGKAEWVKVMAAFLNKEKTANEKFGLVEKQYKALRKKVEYVQQKPLVINNMPYKGAWFVSGGESFEASLLKDAGADYPWFDEQQTGGLRKDFEVMYEIGLHADIWINPGAASSKEEILDKDSRFKDFEAFKNGEIYNNNRRVSPSGGNDYWESGVVHPERMLADLIHIFHPEVLPEHELYYYQKLNGHE